MSKPTPLQVWMDAHPEHTDATLAEAIGISRPSVTRIRNGEFGPSKQTAQALEKVTGVAWYEFIVERASAH